jgi:hypothetical protein
MRKLLGILAAGACLISLAPVTQASVGPDCTAVAGNLVSNCGFESGDFTGWTLTGDDVPAREGNFYGVEQGNDPFPLPDGTPPNHGQYQAYISDFTPHPTTLSQTLATVPGTTYLISFALAMQDEGQIFGPESNLFTASFNASSATNATSFLTLTNLPVQGYTLYTFSETATSASSVLSFAFGNDPSEFLFDDVSVSSAPVPLPNSVILMLCGLGGLGLILRPRPVGSLSLTA